MRINYTVKKEYYIGGGDPFGENNPGVVFNHTYVPRLKELGIKDKNMDEVAKMFSNIYNIGYLNGYDCSTFDSNENA